MKGIIFFVLYFYTRAIALSFQPCNLKATYSLKETTSVVVDIISKEKEHFGSSQLLCQCLLFDCLATFVPVV